MCFQLYLHFCGFLVFPPKTHQSVCEQSLELGNCMQMQGSGNWWATEENAGQLVHYDDLCFCDLLSIYRLYLNHEYLSVLPETQAAKCEAYWRRTQTSGRKHKQKLRMPPLAQQKSLPSLRRDQWQFEP